MKNSKTQKKILDIWVWLVLGGKNPDWRIFVSKFPWVDVFEMKKFKKPKKVLGILDLLGCKKNLVGGELCQFAKLPVGMFSRKKKIKNPKKIFGQLGWGLLLAKILYWGIFDNANIGLWVMFFRMKKKFKNQKRFFWAFGVGWAFVEKTLLLGGAAPIWPWGDVYEWKKFKKTKSFFGILGWLVFGKNPCWGGLFI